MKKNKYGLIRMILSKLTDDLLFEGPLGEMEGSSQLIVKRFTII